MTMTQRRAAQTADEGVEGNSRLTSSVGMLLLVMLAVEGATLLNVRGMLTLHEFLGLMLIPPVALKSASTLYRFVRYYRGTTAYVRKGPPHPILRVLGPVVLVSSVALLATGVALILAGPGGRSTWLTLHQGSFIVWVAAMTVHVLGHIVEAVRTTRDELTRGRHGPRVTRFSLVAASLAAGVAVAVALWPSAQRSENEFRQPGFEHGARVSTVATVSGAGGHHRAGR
jgi:hypothetical protein